MPGNNLPLSLSFRAELVKRVLSDLRAGECCSLIGASGVGKSNLARFLQRPDVQQYYWEDASTWVMLIDTHSLILTEQNAEYEVTELMIRSVIQEAQGRDFSAEFLTWANQLYDRVIEHASTHLALRTLQDLCRRLCQKDGLQFIFIFDQFDDVWQTLDARIFLNLRNLRDQFKYHIVYLAITRDRLQRMRQDTRAVEAFWELFSAHTYGLGPYDERDAYAMVERLTSRAGTNMDEAAQEIVKLSGGHSGILRAIFWAFRNSSSKSLSVDDLLQVQSIHEECEKLWKSLSSAEQHLMQIIAQNLSLHHPTSEALNDLRLKEIISGDPPRPFSPIFTAYGLKNTENNLSGIFVDVRQRQVWLDGQLLKHNWTTLEFRLLEYLARRAGVVCTAEDLTSALYGEAYYKTDERLYALLARLRKALGENANNPKYLLTQHGSGLQLLRGGIINDKE